MLLGKVGICPGKRWPSACPDFFIVPKFELTNLKPSARVCSPSYAFADPACAAPGFELMKVSLMESSVHPSSFTPVTTFVTSN